MTEKQTGSRPPSVAAIVSRLKLAYGEDWSFDIVSHNLLDGHVEIVGELRANGMSARERGSAQGNGEPRFGRGGDAPVPGDLRVCLPPRSPTASKGFRLVVERLTHHAVDARFLHMASESHRMCAASE